MGLGSPIKACSGRSPASLWRSSSGAYSPPSFRLTPPTKQVEVDTAKVRTALKPKTIGDNGRQSRPRVTAERAMPSKRAKRVQDTVPLHPFMRPSERRRRKR